MIVQAGEYVHMDYAAIDVDTKVTDIEFRFQNVGFYTIECNGKI